MDNFFPDSSMNSFSDGIIDDISTSNNSTLITVSYRECPNCRRNQTIRLVAGRNTIIIDEFGNSIPARDLRAGMTIAATFSSAMTRSIPPQSNAYFIRVIRRPASDNISIGRIVDIDRRNRQFTTIRDNNLSSIIRFNISDNGRIFDILGRPTNLGNLFPGMRVRVRHANFMTASIPPQTTAFEVRVVR